MPHKYFITASAAISHQVAYKDGVAVFEAAGSDASAFLLSLYNHINAGYPKFYKMDNLSKLGFLAAELLLKPGFDHDKYPPSEMGVVLCNASASLDADLKYFASVPEYPSPSLFVYTLPNIVIGEICIRHQLHGENSFFVQESFDVSFLYNYVTNLLDTHAIQACICGWAELLGNEYNATFFLVEKEGSQLAMPYSPEYILKIFQPTP